MAELTCPTCQASVPAGARFCLACGSALAIPAAGGMARCAKHHDVAAAHTCARCGSYACTQCLVTRPSGELYCAACAEREPQELLPWDRREELGTLKAYWKTCMLLIQSPTKTFNAAPREGNVGSSALFVLLSGYAGLLTTMLMYVVLFGAMFATMGKELSQGAYPPPVWLFPAIFGAFAIFGPLFQVPATMALSALDHLMLKLIGAQPGTWAVTYRAHALSMAPFLIGLVPICGLYVYPIWSIVLRCLAYRGLHKTTTGKAVAGALVPTFSMAFCCGGGYVALIAFAISQGK
ncbi:MAG TPA: zinc-ribbon domain-containing protein [Myxococcaceae bacterium]|nr:zinc-ribbon domain-containing protein [Myxococcaceae bacterium]